MSKLHTIDICYATSAYEIGDSFVIQIENDISYHSIMEIVRNHISRQKNIISSKIIIYCFNAKDVKEIKSKGFYPIEPSAERIVDLNSLWNPEHTRFRFTYGIMTGASGRSRGDRHPIDLFNISAVDSDPEFDDDDDFDDY